MTDLLAHVVQYQGQHLVQQPGNPGNPVESEDRALERFQKFSSPKFLRGPDSNVAERWLEKMIDIFAALHYSEERQVTFAVFQWEGAVRSWWNVIRMKWDREQIPRTWVNFMLEFNAKYFPSLVQEKKEDEFIRLYQGTQTVADEAVEKALRVENARLQVRNFQVKKQGFSASSSTQGDKSSPLKFGRRAGGGRLQGMARRTPPRGGQTGRSQQRSASKGSSASVSHGPCGFCGKPNHTEDNCWRKERKCLSCGSTEHQIANCPMLPREARVTTQSSKANSGQSKVEGKNPKVPTRVYSLEPHQVPDSLEVAEGTIPVFHRLARILIDPGATHSFVNPEFRCGIEIQPVSLPYDLEVSTPTRDKCLITSMMYANCEI
ncbi:uncharacterized protein LOC113771250 [Coffea eugenioides]|uniref:uncharacterized protein LOC113771250 n=1 Tax=Coffea eugenioides TaxID=49369 RepID=UPI000F60FBF6|nr:uncharacterized protein LOC113771250 [Coffea eugenioides]